MLCIEGRIALASFTTFAVLSLYQTKILFADYWSYKYIAVACISAVCCTLVFPYTETIKRAALLGTLFGGSIMSAFLVQGPWSTICIYAVILSSFHFSEYMLTAVYNPESLSTDSFLLNHSKEYGIAAVASWIEFLIEAYLFPNSKSFSFINFIGLLLVVFGELMRKGAMITAKSNFNHIVQADRKRDHILVTHGLYSWSRHPSYVGWFYWSVGTQILLCNPLCTVAYTLASWKFFDERIKDEEMYLLSFFDEEYVMYLRSVPTRLPFIRGLEDFASKLD